MSRAVRTIVLASCVLALAMASVASPALGSVISSSNFSFGFGSTQSGSETWTTSENEANNSATTQGDFFFQPTVTGIMSTNNGCTFADRTLASGGSTGYCGDIPSMALTVQGQYNGAAPADAWTNPNYQLKLEITGVSIYVTEMPGSQVGEARWAETTAGHTQEMASGVATTPFAWGTGVASNYHKVTWNPDDYNVSLTNLNDSFSRSFVVPTFAGINDYRAGDGLEIFGRVSLVYNVVPEPASCIMTSIGVCGLLAYAWRKRK